MPIRYEIDDARRCVHILATSVLPMSEMLAAVEQVADDPRFQSDYCVLFDLTKGDYAADLSDGEAFVSVLKRRKEDFQNRFALIVPEQLHLLAKLYSVLAQAGGFDRMQCFTDIETARGWCEEPR